MSEITRVLSAIEQGDPKAANELLPLVYEQLRKLAAARLAHEQPGQTLQATALVHEAYLRLVPPAGGEPSAGRDPAWNSRGHFFAAAAEAMRRILIENARRKKQEKHGGQFHRVAWENLQVGMDSPPDELLQLDETLEELANVDAQAAKLVKLHCFAGLPIEQAAELLGISTRTAYRDWAYARAWLYKNAAGNLD